jgi:hypothetical protein
MPSYQVANYRRTSPQTCSQYWKHHCPRIQRAPHNPHLYVCFNCRPADLATRHESSVPPNAIDGDTFNHHQVHRSSDREKVSPYPPQVPWRNYSDNRPAGKQYLFHCVISCSLLLRHTWNVRSVLSGLSRQTPWDYVITMNENPSSPPKNLCIMNNDSYTDLRS